MNLEKLIVLVKDHPAIYDISHSDHWKRDCIVNIWMKIAQEMGVDSEKCREKWHNLRSNYMRERRQLREKKSPGSEAATKVKWSYFDIMSFLGPHSQPKNATENFPETPAPTDVLFTKSEEIEKGSTEDTERGNMNSKHQVRSKERGLRNKKQPSGRNRGGRSSRLNGDYIDKQYLNSLKQIGNRMEETSNDSDRMYLLSLLPAMKQLSPLDNMDFRIEVQENLRRKFLNSSARNFEPYQSTSSGPRSLTSRYDNNTSECEKSRSSSSSSLSANCGINDQ